MGVLLGFISLLYLTTTPAVQRGMVDDLGQLGMQAFTAGNYLEAELYFRLAVKNAEATQATEEVMAFALADLAEFLRNLGQYKESEELFTRALEIFKRKGLIDRRCMPLLMTNLGRLYQETGRYRLSESVLKESLSLTLKQPCPKHSHTAEVLNSLGVLYNLMNRNRLAETTFQRALTVSIQEGNKEARIAILAHMAAFYAEQKKWKMALSLLSHSLNMAAQSFGPEHPRTAVIMNNLGQVYFGDRKLVEADGAIRRALEIEQKVFGTEHPTVAATTLTLAAVVMERGSYDEAKILYNHALRVRETYFGTRAAEVAEVLEHLAKLLRKIRSSQASEVEARARAIRMELSYTIKLNKTRDR